MFFIEVLLVNTCIVHARLLVETFVAWNEKVRIVVICHVTSF